MGVGLRSKQVIGGGKNTGVCFLKTNTRMCIVQKHSYRFTELVFIQTKQPTTLLHRSTTQNKPIKFEG